MISKARRMLAIGSLCIPLGAHSAPAELFFSEYVEGSSNNKALEIFNGTGSAIDLGAAGYSVQMFFNGNTSAGLTINLTGILADGDVHVLAHGSADAAILAIADQAVSATWYNGDDAIVLRRGTTFIDVIGQVGFDPGAEWGSGLASTADNTLQRKSLVEAGDAVASDAFDPSADWSGFASNTFTGLGSHSIASAAIPEPATSVLLLLALAGVLLQAGYARVSSQYAASILWPSRSRTKQP
jgi:predicted extracellular nuclease